MARKREMTCRAVNVGEGASGSSGGQRVDSFVRQLHMFVDSGRRAEDPLVSPGRQLPASEENVECNTRQTRDGVEEGTAGLYVNEGRDLNHIGAGRVVEGRPHGRERAARVRVCGQLREGPPRID